MKLLCATGREIHEGAAVLALINTTTLPCHVKRVRLSDKDKKVVAKKPTSDPSRSALYGQMDHDLNRTIIRPRSFLILKLRVDNYKGTKGTHISEEDRVVLRDNNVTLAMGYVMRAYDTNARLRKEVERMRKEMVELAAKQQKENPVGRGRATTTATKPKPKAKPPPRRK